MSEGLSFCEELGLDYKCDRPLPRSAFGDSGPLCRSLGEYLYDPANCDPGFWSGCSSSNPSDCIPSNDTSTTKWGGHFTTINVTSGETVVFTGHFGGTADNNEQNIGDGACPLSFYCPGKEDVDICVDLCPPNSYCPNSSVALTCPKNFYCPVATSVPKECINLESCDVEGLRRFDLGSAMLAMMIFIGISVIYLYAGGFMVNRRALARKEAHMRTKSLEKDMAMNENGSDNALAAVSNIEEGGEDQAKVKRRSTLSAPDMTIDIDCQRLRLTIPQVGTIMRGVSGRIEHGQLTAIMGPSGAGKYFLGTPLCVATFNQTTHHSSYSCFQVKQLF